MFPGSLRLSPHQRLLGVILALGLALRLWGLDFGLPNLSRPDEQNIADAVFRILNSFFAGEPSLNPHFFHYSSLYIYLIALLDWIYYLLGYLSGAFPNAEAFYRLYLDDWSSFFLIQRTASALFGTAGLWALYRLAKDAAQSRTVGLLAAFLLAVTYLHVRDSHFGVTDMLATLLITLSLWQTVRFEQTRRWKTLLRALIFAGLAASTKYPAGLAAVPALLSYGFYCRERGITVATLLRQPITRKELFRLGLALMAPFFLASPYILLDFPEFLEDYLWQSGVQFQISIVDLGLGWTRHLTYSLWYGLGGLYLITSLLSIAWIWRACPGRIHWYLAGFAALYYIVIGNSHMVFVRYIIPLLPILALYSAWGLRDACYRAQQKDVFYRVALSVGVLLIAWQSLYNAVSFDQLAARPDTRTQASQWLLGHTNPGDAVGIGRDYTQITLPRSYHKFQLQERGPNENHDSFPDMPDGRAAYTGNPINNRNEYKISTYRDIARLREIGIRYVAVAQTPLSVYTVTEPELEALAQAPEVKLAQRFSPFRSSSDDKSAYDQIDAFFIPYSDMSHRQFPGPDILIYDIQPHH